MRYTEVRPAKVAHALLDYIDKNTVDFRENYDGSEQEPVVPPARYPNLLVNGSGRIAGGMATNIPPLGIVRQVHYSLANENSIDLVLFLNGLSVATAELKTDFTQSVRWCRGPIPI